MSMLNLKKKIAVCCGILIVLGVGLAWAGGSQSTPFSNDKRKIYGYDLSSYFELCKKGEVGPTRGVQQNDNYCKCFVENTLRMDSDDEKDREYRTAFYKEAMEQSGKKPEELKANEKGPAYYLDPCRALASRDAVIEAKHLTPVSVARCVGFGKKGLPDGGSESYCKCIAAVYEEDYIIAFREQMEQIKKYGYDKAQDVDGIIGEKIANRIVKGIKDPRRDAMIKACGDPGVKIKSIDELKTSDYSDITMEYEQNGEKVKTTKTGTTEMEIHHGDGKNQEIIKYKDIMADPAMKNMLKELGVPDNIQYEEQR